MGGDEPLMHFKYQLLNNNVGSTFFKQKGAVTEEALLLATETIPFTAIAATHAVDNRLVLQLDPDFELSKHARKILQKGCLVMQLREAAKLKSTMDRILSKQLVEAHAQELMAAGKGETFRAELCPCCGAAIDLSELDATPYVYCIFCESIFTGEGQILSDGRCYRVCEECGLYDSIQGYTEFYFYFLMVVYGYSYKRRHMCTSCAGKVFWKMLACNFIFLLGLPSTFWLKFQSMRTQDCKLKGLRKANALAVRGRAAEASALYAGIKQVAPDHPGILLNEARAHLKAKNLEAAVGHLVKAVESCANYLPALRLLQAFAEAGKREAA